MREDAKIPHVRKDQSRSNGNGIGNDKRDRKRVKDVEIPLLLEKVEERSRAEKK